MKTLKRLVYLLTFALLLLAARSAQATWSIVVADSATGEVAIASVTCLVFGDLRADTPVILVGIGAAAVQSSGDPDGSRRQVMRAELENGTPPQEIIEILAAIKGHNTRQYGIVDTLGRAATFTGKSPRNWAGGVTGTSRTMAYAIQGNILAGPCVVPATVEALLLDDTMDIPGKLMAAMQAARNAGGDGRCSCDSGTTGCGCPPPDFTKSGHIGYMLVARRGDIDDPVCDLDGCADGDYFMAFDVAFPDASDPDPVATLQEEFNAWRISLEGFPDAVQSEASLAPDGANFEMTVQLKDWQKINLELGIATITVAHELDSDHISQIGAPTEIGPGLFSVPLTVPAGNIGTDRFKVTADDGLQEIILMPSPELSIGGVDADGDGFDAFPVGLDCDDTDSGVNPDASEICDDSIDNDCDGLVDSADSDCAGGPVCKQKNDACSANSECCSGKCNSKGKCVGGGSADASSVLTAWSQIDVLRMATGNYCPLSRSFYSATIQ